MVRSYTDEELLNNVKSLPSFNGFPGEPWLLFVRSKEDLNDQFDDKVYMYQLDQFIMVTSCTTNKGNKGTAVMEADSWYYDSYAYGLHKGKMPALRQAKGIPYRRDLTNDFKTNPTTPIKNDIIHMNIHGATYLSGSKQIAQRIGGWSEGCLVLNNNADYEKVISICKRYPKTSIVLINEF